MLENGVETEFGLESRGAMANQASALPPESAHIGAKVSIRIQDAEPGKYRDILGHLVDPTHVEDKNGIIKEFDPSSIVAWKLVNNTE